MKKQLLYLCAGILIGCVIGSVAYARGDRHPEMRAAMQSLQAAEQDLKNASSDYGGHREKAMSLIHGAQEEIKAGVAYANGH